MALRLGIHVRSGVIDNSVKGKVTGKIELEGVPFPLELDLEGDARPDLAGCIFSFTNPNPEPFEDEILVSELKKIQVGQAGKMTAAEKREFMDVDEPFLDDFLPKTKVSNVPYIEWFNNEQGRFVIEGFDYEQSIDLPRWTLSESELAAQQELETAAKTMHLNFAVERFQEINDEIREEEESVDLSADDEFSWEYRLRFSDRRAEAYRILLEEADTNEEMEELARRAYQRDDEEEGGEFHYEEDEGYTREEFIANEEVIEICDRIRNFVTFLTEEIKEEQYDPEVVGELFQLIVKARTLADMCTEEHARQERGFLLAYLKREVARSQSLAVTFVTDSMGLIEDRLWQIRDHLVLLAGYIRSE